MKIAISPISINHDDRNGWNCKFFFVVIASCDYKPWLFFWPKPLILSSSVGRASAFGSVGSNESGLYEGPGSKFFLSFFAEICHLTPPGGQNMHYKYLLVIFDKKYGQKSRFIDLLSLSTTEMGLQYQNHLVFWL